MVKGGGFCFQKRVGRCGYRMAGWGWDEGGGGGGGGRGVRMRRRANGGFSNNCKAQHSNALTWPDSV